MTDTKVTRLYTFVVKKPVEYIKLRDFNNDVFKGLRFQQERTDETLGKHVFWREINDETLENNVLKSNKKHTIRSSEEKPTASQAEVPVISKCASVATTW